VIADMRRQLRGRPAAGARHRDRFLKETGAHAVKLEGGERVVEQIATLTQAGIRW